MIKVSLPTFYQAVAIGLLSGAMPALSFAADDDAAITPYRPSVSNPAQLPASGQLELELGGLRERSADERRTSVPYLLKLAFNREWGVLIGGDAHLWTRDETGATDQGAGDTAVIVKRAWAVDDQQALGLELGAKLATAPDRLGSGKTDYTVNTIYSREFAAVHGDFNFNATRIGLTEPGVDRLQWGASAAFSTALAERWGVTGEVSGTRQRGAGNGVQLLTALTYSPSKRITFDIGIARAIRPTPASTLIFAGVVIPIARLW